MAIEQAEERSDHFHLIMRARIKHTHIVNERRTASGRVSDQRPCSGNRKITPETIAKFSALISRKLRGNDSMLRTAYTRMFVAKVTVSQTQIVISGPKFALEAGVAKDNLKPSGLVPSFDQKWCPRPDSNGHSFRNRILSPARLPIPPLGHSNLGRTLRSGGSSNRASAGMQAHPYFFSSFASVFAVALP